MNPIRYLLDIDPVTGKALLIVTPDFTAQILALTDLPERLAALEKWHEQKQCSHSSVVMETEGLECGWCGKRLQETAAEKPAQPQPEPGAGDEAAVEALMLAHVERDSDPDWPGSAAALLMRGARAIAAQRADNERLRARMATPVLNTIADLDAAQSRITELEAAVEVGREIAKQHTELSAQVETLPALRQCMVDTADENKALKEQVQALNAEKVLLMQDYAAKVDDHCKALKETESTKLCCEAEIEKWQEAAADKERDAKHEREQCESFKEQAHTMMVERNAAIAERDQERAARAEAERRGESLLRDANTMREEAERKLAVMESERNSLRGDVAVLTTVLDSERVDYRAQVATLTAKLAEAPGAAPLTREEIASIIAFELAHHGNEMACAQAILCRYTQKAPAEWSSYVRAPVAEATRTERDALKAKLAEIGNIPEFQDQLRSIVIAACREAGLSEDCDGSGCDSGDWMDLTKAEVRLGLNALGEALTDARAKLAEAEGLLRPMANGLRQFAANGIHADPNHAAWRIQAEHFAQQTDAFLARAAGGEVQS